MFTGCLRVDSCL
jgi:hypothetical protein